MPWFVDELSELLGNHLPVQSPQFPRLAELRGKYRTILFNRRCRLLVINGICLHSYCRAWAERAMSCGYPERFAQAALGRNGKPVHRASGRQGEFTLPPLDKYDRLATKRIVLPLGIRGVHAGLDPNGEPPQETANPRPDLLGIELWNAAPNNASGDPLHI